MTNMNGVNKALSIASSVAKRSTRVFADALPILSVAGNVLNAVARTTDAQTFLSLMVRKYSGFDLGRGTFDITQAGEGLGALIVTTAARSVIRALS